MSVVQCLRPHFPTMTTRAKRTKGARSSFAPARTEGTAKPRQEPKLAPEGNFFSRFPPEEAQPHEQYPCRFPWLNRASEPEE